ncbi:SH3 domain-containing protein, partial [Candidatus Pelagibacter ubique]|nr:SH3 domain-containing protein [Candidatus Pelagibacter ubique]
MKDNYFYKKPLSNIYKKPNAFSEVTSQILYGEKFKIISKNKNWIKIKVSFDNYTGYIKNKYYTKDQQP